MKQNIMTRLLVTILSLLFFYSGVAQAKLAFEITTYDFGEIEEMAGYAEYTFNFTNTGDTSVTITNVEPSCGCTAPDWSREEIKPGEKGFVQAKFNPGNRPGRFKKSLRLTTTSAEDSLTLYIQGFVKPGPKMILDEFPVSLGDLRLKYRSLNLGRITTEKIAEKAFDIYNSGDNVQGLLIDDMDIPAHLTFSMEPDSLDPKQRGLLKVTYDPKIKDDLGLTSDNVILKTTQKVSGEVHVTVAVEEFFLEMTAKELGCAARLEISDRIYDFGKVSQGEMVEFDLVLRNTGQENLNLRKIKSNCECVTFGIKSQNIKKGEEQILKIFFDTTGRRNNQYKTVAIFSNDPSAPTQMVTLKGTVKIEKEQ